MLVHKPTAEDIFANQAYPILPCVLASETVISNSLACKGNSTNRFTANNQKLLNTDMLQGVSI